MLLAKSGTRSRRPDMAGRRHMPRALGLACATLVAALPIAACGSSSGSSSSPAGHAANVAAAKAAIASYTGHPGAFPVNQPLSKPLPAGTKIAYLQTTDQTSVLSGKLLSSAVQKLGDTLSIVNAGSTAQTTQAALSTVLAMKPDGLVLTGINPSLYGGRLKSLSDAGIKIVSVSVTGPTKQYGVTFNYAGDPTFQRAGRLLADWVIAHKGAGANVAFYGIPEISFTPIMEQAFKQELNRNCPACKARSVSVDISALGTTAPSTIVNDLQSHPATNVAVFSLGSLAEGVPTAMKAAGLSLTTLVYAPEASNLQDIKNGRITAGLAIDYALSMWTVADVTARVLENNQPTASEQVGEVPFQFLEQQDITFNAANGWTAYPDYVQRFASLWHPAS